MLMWNIADTQERKKSWSQVIYVFIARVTGRDEGLDKK